MLSRSFISNFKLFRNAGFWTCFIVVCSESLLQQPLKKRLFNHQVDQLALKIATQAFDAPVLVLGDSVAENVFRNAVGQDHRFAVFASNQAIEMTGQYFFLQRYLEKNPAPGIVVLMAGEPLKGDLEQYLTENYVQRVFTRWREIRWMAQQTLDPVFTLKSLAYKFSPSFRYRSSLSTPLLSKPQTESVPLAQPPQISWSLSDRIRNHWQKTQGQNVSTKAWVDMLKITGNLNIPLVFIPTPTNPQGVKQTAKSLKEIAGFKSGWLHLTLWADEAITFPFDYFIDNTHFNKEGYRQIRGYQQELYLRMLQAGNRQEQTRKSDSRLNMNDLTEREKVSLPSPFQLKGFYPLERRRSQAFQWTHPTFTIQVSKTGLFLLETANNSPTGTLEVHSDTYQQSFELKKGTQQLNIPVSKANQIFTFSFPSWSPGNGDARELGIAVKALGTLKEPF